MPETTNSNADLIDFLTRLEAVLDQIEHRLQEIGRVPLVEQHRSTSQPFLSDDLSQPREHSACHRSR